MASGKARNGQGSVTRQEDAYGNPLPGKSANWLIRWRDADGKQRSKSSGTTDKAKAIRELNAILGAVANDEPIPESGRNAFTFDDAARDIVNDYRVNARRTVDDLKRRIALHLTPAFGGMRLTDIDTPKIKQYIADRLAAKATRATVRNELAALKRMFTLANHAGIVTRRPHFPMPNTKGNARRGFFEAEQFEAVRAALPEFLRGPIAFAYLTGWRLPSEILTLEWSQVDERAVRLEPGTTKNDEGRTFPLRLFPALGAVITEQRRRADVLKANGTITPYVFTDDAGGRLFETVAARPDEADGPEIEKVYAATVVREAWLAAVKAAGVPGRIPHDFRRTAVRNLVRAGVPEKQAMKLTGHLTREVFDRYDIVDEADLERAVERYAEYVATPRNAPPSPRVVRMAASAAAGRRRRAK